jgi:DNA (cytosine-5)-methyltransferase 1
MKSTATKKKIAVSLFSGAGGFDLGLKSAGFEIGIAIDNNPIALATYQQNFPNATVLCKDIREVTGKEIRAHIQAKYPDWDGEIHVVFGGPPCQGFSVAGQQNLEDERNGLVGEFVRLVLELNPLAAIQHFQQLWGTQSKLKTLTWKGARRKTALCNSRKCCNGECARD